MVGSYKSAVTRRARPLHPDFRWQTRFHDHVIRSADAHLRIATYVRENPRRWRADVFRQG
ncbi:MAG: hypothetical protein WBA12_13070 [Catalinimonas sp.]